MHTVQKSGFTLVELLIVITVIGILSGILVSVINPQSYKNKAQDAVVMKNVGNLATGIEAFGAAEGRFPATHSSYNPLNGPDGSAVSNYIDFWPTTGGYRYSLPDGAICISAPRATNPNEYYKYVSPWGSSTTGGRRDCTETVIICNNACSNSSSSNNISNCRDLEGNLCN